MRVFLPYAVLLYGPSETEVRYKGTAVEDDIAGYSFDATPNPAGKAPISRARVTASLHANGKNRQTFTGADGSWEGIDRVFGETAQSDTPIEIRFEADGYESFSYTSDYDDARGPIKVKFLNVRLKKKTSM